MNQLLSTGANQMLWPPSYGENDFTESLKTDCMESNNLHHSGRNEARTFELEAIDELQKFKQLKKMEEMVYEKERAKARLRKLSKR